MSHVSGRTSSSKEKASKVFYKKIKPASKDALPSGKMGADCKCGKCSNSESQQRLKRLRTRKERDHLRDGRKQPPRAKSCLHYQNHQTSSDLSYVHQYCTNTSDSMHHVVPVLHEHSVITDSRLIGHHGLFNHEVKSFDIERLLSEQRKLNRSGKLQDNRNQKSLSALQNELLIDCTDKETTRKALQTPEIVVSKRREKKTIESNSHGSELTPGQRPKKTLISSSESTKDDNDVVITAIKEALPVVYESNSDSHQTPRSFSENKNILPGSFPSFLEATPRNTNSDPTPPLPSSPPVSRTSSSPKTQRDNPDADSVAMSVKAIAASLCSSISFSLLGRKHLVAESRERLVKVLQKRHGHKLKSNILKVQKQLLCSDDGEGQEEVPELSISPVFNDRKEVPFSIANNSMPSKTRMFSSFSFEKTGRLSFDWNSFDWSNPLDQTAEWMGAEHPLVQDGGFGRSASPPLSLDFDFRNSVSKEREHPFSTPFAPACTAGPRSADHIDHFFISTQDQEFAWPEPSNDMRSFSNMRTERHRQSPLTSFVNYRNDPLHSAVPFPQMHRSFETHKDSYGTKISEEIPYYLRDGSFESSSFISTSPALRPQDMAHYPPSYMLERDPIQSSGPTFPSPEQWSFPPMRLY